MQVLVKTVLEFKVDLFGNLWHNAGYSFETEFPQLGPLTWGLAHNEVRSGLKSLKWVVFKEIWDLMQLNIKVNIICNYTYIPANKWKHITRYFNTSLPAQKNIFGKSTNNARNRNISPTDSVACTTTSHAIINQKKYWKLRNEIEFESERQEEENNV